MYCDGRLVMNQAENGTGQSGGTGVAGGSINSLSVCVAFLCLNF